jgi:predicted RNase H-like HicB family nuclease
MKKEELIGKKVRGFRFEKNKYRLHYAESMDNYIGKIGVIEEYDAEFNSYRVKFEDGMSYHYPAERIEHHLIVEEENEKTKVVCTNTICQGECGECNHLEVVSSVEPTKKVDYNNVSVRICEDNSLIGYYTEDCGITSFGKTFDELLRNLQHAKKAIEESRERLAKEDLEDAKITANKGVDISFDYKSSNDLKSESLKKEKEPTNPLDDLPIIGDGVLMEVSDDEQVWYKRIVFVKYGKYFLAHDGVQDIKKIDYNVSPKSWIHARPITPKTKISRKEFESKFEIID